MSLLRSAFLLLTAAAMLSCRGASYTTVEYIYPLEREVRAINTTANPSGVCTVRAGETPRAVAARAGVDFDLFAETNGIDADTKLQAGDLLIVPATQWLHEAPPPLSAGSPTVRVTRPQRGRRTALLLPDRRDEVPGASRTDEVRASSAGVVTEVLMDYPSLGDVVIIENDREKIVYSGDFEPVVAKGASVSAGDTIATGAARGSVKARVFGKDR